MLLLVLEHSLHRVRHVGHGDCWISFALRALALYATLSKVLLFILIKHLLHQVRPVVLVFECILVLDLFWIRRTVIFLVLRIIFEQLSVLLLILQVSALQILALLTCSILQVLESVQLALEVALRLWVLIIYVLVVEWALHSRSISLVVLASLLPQRSFRIR